MREVSNLANHFLTAIAAFSALFSLITWLFNLKISDNSIFSWLFLGGILIICLVYSFFQCKQKNNISLILGPKFRVNILKGDLFDNSHHGIIVIPVNEYFDTIVDDCIISSKTIHGQFIIKYFNHNISDLDNAISKSLSNKKYDLNDQRKRGKKRIYPLGTCADIICGQDLYVLVSLTHFNKTNNTDITLLEFNDVIYSLCQHLEEIANMRPIYMPLIGAGQSKIFKSPQRILFSILEHLELIPFSFPAGINIIIHQTPFKEIDLRLIERCYNEVIINSH